MAQWRPVFPTKQQTPFTKITSTPNSSGHFSHIANYEQDEASRVAPTYHRSHPNVQHDCALAGANVRTPQQLAALRHAPRARAHTIAATPQTTLVSAVYVDSSEQ